MLDQFVYSLWCVLNKSELFAEVALTNVSTLSNPEEHSARWTLVLSKFGIDALHNYYSVWTCHGHCVFVFHNTGWVTAFSPRRSSMDQLSRHIIPMTEMSSNENTAVADCRSDSGQDSLQSLCWLVTFRSITRIIFERHVHCLFLSEQSLHADPCKHSLHLP